MNTKADLEDWVGAHGGGQPFTPTLMNDPGVLFLAADGPHGIEAGAVAYCDGATVGVSNILALQERLRPVYSQVGEFMGALFPQYPIVGYEHGGELSAALESGFTDVGRLRVWSRG